MTADKIIVWFKTKLWLIIAKNSSLYYTTNQPWPVAHSSSREGGKQTIVHHVPVTDQDLSIWGQVKLHDLRNINKITVSLLKMNEAILILDSSTSWLTKRREFYFDFLRNKHLLRILNSNKINHSHNNIIS